MDKKIIFFLFTFLIFVMPTSAQEGTMQVLVLIPSPVNVQESLTLVSDGINVGSLEIDIDPLISGSYAVIHENQDVGTLRIDNGLFHVIQDFIAIDVSSCFPSKEQIQCTASLVLQNKNDSSELLMTYLLTLNENSSTEKATFSLVQNNTVGSITFEFSNIQLDPFEISELFFGFVFTEDGSTYGSGQMQVEDENGVSIQNAQVEGGYFATLISAHKDTKIKFFVDGILVHEDTIDIANSQNELNITVPIAQDGSFSDEDRDGIPDESDVCPGSKDTIVTVEGCDCNQLSCDGECIVENLLPVCVETCSDNIQNQNEEAVDCGGLCPACKEPSCEEEGCREGFICQAGLCVKQVDLFGLSCKTDTGYSIKLNENNCPSQDQVREDVRNYLHIDISGLAFFGGWAEEEVNDLLRYVTLCIDTKKVGCSRFDLRCPGKEVFEKQRPHVEAEIKKELDERTDLGWFLDLFVSVNYQVDLSSFEITSSYECPKATIYEDNICSRLTQHETQSIVNVVLLIDGLKTQIEQSEYINELRENDPFINGSIEFLYLFTDSIRYGDEPTRPGHGEVPSLEDVLKATENCPAADAAVLVSLTNDFLPDCLGTSPLCTISSLHDEDLAELLSKLLATKIRPDEVDPATVLFLKDNPGIIEELRSYRAALQSCELVSVDELTLAELLEIIVKGTCDEPLPILPKTKEVVIDSVIVFGDSITYGHNLSNPEKENWAYLYSQTFREAQLQNFAFSGATTRDVIEEQLPTFESAGEENVVGLWIGANDALELAPFDDFEFRYKFIIGKLRAIESKRIFLVNIPDFSQVVPDDDIQEIVDERLAELGFTPSGSVDLSAKIHILLTYYNFIIHEIAKKNNLLVIDIFSEKLDDSRLAADGFHPSEEGQRQLAERIKEQNDEWFDEEFV